MTVMINCGCFYIRYIILKGKLNKISVIKLKIFWKTNNTVWFLALLSVCDIYLEVLKIRKGWMYVQKRTCFITQTKHMMKKKIKYAYLRQRTSMLGPILCLETLNVTHWRFCFSLFLSLKTISECQNLLYSWTL